MPNRNPYSILGVSSNATLTEIENRFRFLRQAYHPDKFRSATDKRRAEEEFKRIGEAYEILTDSVQRSRMDGAESGSSSFHSTGQTSPAASGARPASPASPLFGIALMLIGSVLMLIGGGFLVLGLGFLFEGDGMSEAAGLFICILALVFAAAGAPQIYFGWRKVRK